VAWLIDPTLVTTQPMNVAVETRSALSDGRTLCDVYGTTGRAVNAEVGLGLDAERFWDLMIATLATYAD
jgi:ribosylpyrimidine nucleosidase